MILIRLLSEIFAIVFIGLLIGAVLHTVSQVGQLVEDLVVYAIKKFKLFYKIVTNKSK